MTSPRPYRPIHWEKEETSALVHMVTDRKFGSVWSVTSQKDDDDDTPAHYAYLIVRPDRTTLRWTRQSSLYAMAIFTGDWSQFADVMGSPEEEPDPEETD